MWLLLCVGAFIGAVIGGQFGEEVAPWFSFGGALLFPVLVAVVASLLTHREPAREVEYEEGADEEVHTEAL